MPKYEEGNKTCLECTKFWLCYHGVLPEKECPRSVIQREGQAHQDDDEIEETKEREYEMV